MVNQAQSPQSSPEARERAGLTNGEGARSVGLSPNVLVLSIDLAPWNAPI